MVTDVDGDAAAKVAGAIRTEGGNAAATACDVTENSGPKPFDMSMPEFERAYKLNVFSTLRLTQLGAEHMRQRGGGAVLNISSMAGENTNSNMASY